jgi:hypothetical protein
MVNCRMRRGLLQDYANQVCQKAAGWLMTLDGPLLLAAGTGTLEIDLLTGQTLMNGTGQARPPLTYSEVGPWLDEARSRDDVPPDVIEAFNLNIHFAIEEGSDRGLETRRVFLDCSSRVKTADRTFEGRHRKTERWSRSSPAAAWDVRDE